MTPHPRLNPRADSIPVALGADQLEPEPMVSEALIVAQQQRRAAYLRHHNIQVSVPIDISEGRPATHDRFQQIRAALRRGHGLETDALFVTAIPEQLRRLTILLQRIQTVYFRLEVPIGGENVQPAIQVI